MAIQLHKNFLITIYIVKPAFVATSIKQTSCIKQARTCIHFPTIGGTDGCSPKACNNGMCSMVKEQFCMKT